MSAEAHHSTKQYVKIWAILCGLFVISVAGPMLEIKILTLITAFGIAIVKALMVAAYFMHLNIEKRFVWYVLYSMLLLVGLFFAGTAADVFKADGRNWTNHAAHQLIEEHSTPEAGHGEHK